MQIAGESVASRAIGYGFRGVRCNGNDLHDVLAATQEAVQSARAGRGPTLIEAVTYRIKGHSEHDRAEYRKDDELARWQAKDPIVMWELFLEKLGIDVPKLRTEVDAAVRDLCARAADFALASPYPPGPEAMSHLTADPSAADPIDPSRAQHSAPPTSKS